MDFRGSYVAIATPMHEDGSLALDALRGLVSAHLEQGTAGFVVAGTTGESASLDHAEYSRLVSLVVEQVAGAVPVIAGAGSPATAKAVTLAGIAEQSGADALLCVTPYYLRTTQEGLYQHFRSISEAVGLPLVLYNVPGRTGVDLLPKTVGRLAELNAVRAIKEAVPGRQRVEQLTAACGDRLQILSGDDCSCLEAMLHGAVGVVSVTANIAPTAMAQLCDLVDRGDAQAAHALDARLMPLHEGLMAEPNPIPVKWALARNGRIPPGIRLPLVTATDELAQQLGAALDVADDLVTLG